MTEKARNDKDLEIKIETTQGPWDTTFSKTTKVQEVISAIIEHYGFAKNGNYELRLVREPNEPLKPERPLVSYGIRDKDILRFTDLGVGV